MTCGQRGAAVCTQTSDAEVVHLFPNCLGMEDGIGEKYRDKEQSKLLGTHIRLVWRLVTGVVGKETLVKVCA